jgi:hypothetical protein
MGSHLLNVPQLFQLLLLIDQDLAAEVQARGCPHCGSKLHCGDFPRKPRGCPKRFLEAYSRRTSFDCSACRKRSTPASARFFPRRTYVSAVIVLVSARQPPQRSWLARELGVADRTVERWRQWWRQRFVATPVYQSLRGSFLPAISTVALPTSLLDRIEADDATERLARFLKLLAPLSNSSPLCVST